MQNNILKKFVRRITCASALVILFDFVSLSQGNLVLNGSFEAYSTCPNNTGQIYYAVSWFQPNTAGESSDFYNVCNYPSNPNVPFAVGFQYARTGNGLGAVNFFHDTIPSMKDWNREYLEVGIASPLTTGKKYCIRFYTVKGNWSMWAIKNLQAVLTNDSLFYYDSNYGYIPSVTPIMEADAIVTDTLNWTAVETTYLAAGGEKFITIGNFSPGDSVVFQQVLPYSATPNTLGYYLIDDVSVYEQPDIFAGVDTIIPPGDSIQLGITGRPDVFYSWSPTIGLNDPTIANPMAAPGISTTYTLTVTDTNSLACTSVFYDTVTVLVGFIGVEENDWTQNIVLYPNPSNGFVYYQTELKGNEKGRIELHDLLGNVVAIEKLRSGVNKGTLDLSVLSEGIYIYKVIINNELRSSGKLVISK